MKYLNTVREVMGAILEGKEVEFKGTEMGEWLPLKNLHIPVGNIDDKINYLCRIKTTKPSIDWSHVSDKFKYLAKDENGSIFIYENKPEIKHVVWWIDGSAYANVSAFKSLDVGDCDWTESLVERPRD